MATNLYSGTLETLGNSVLLVILVPKSSAGTISSRELVGRRRRSKTEEKNLKDVLRRIKWEFN